MSYLRCKTLYVALLIFLAGSGSRAGAESLFDSDQQTPVYQYDAQYDGRTFFLSAAEGAAGGAAISPGTLASRAAAELSVEEHQHILRFIPDFNTSNVSNAAPLSARQKFDLALKGSTDPFSFVAAAFDAGLNSFGHPEYGTGAIGYQKRAAASYADSFNGNLLGNALFPILLHQDPRYFRRGSGTIRSRVWYAMLSTVKTKDDQGRWVPNYSNVLGNFSAGAIANLYYPADQRGMALTIQRSATVTAEGALGAVLCEFWPDISRWMATKRMGHFFVSKN